MYNEQLNFKNEFKIPEIIKDQNNKVVRIKPK